MRQHVARKVHSLPPAALHVTQVHVVQRVSQRHRARPLRVTKELVRRGRPRAGRAHDQRGRGAGWCQLPRSLEGCGGVAGAWGEAEVGAASEQGARPLGGEDLEVVQRRPLAGAGEPLRQGGVAACTDVFCCEPNAGKGAVGPVGGEQLGELEATETGEPQRSPV